MTAGFSRTGQDACSGSVRIHARRDMRLAGSAEAAEAPVVVNAALEHGAKQPRWHKRALRKHKPVNPDKDSLI